MKTVGFLSLVLAGWIILAVTAPHEATVVALAVWKAFAALVAAWLVCVAVAATLLFLVFVAVALAELVDRVVDR